MAIEPRFSPDLRDRLVELFGPDGALELMERVPQVPWHEIATKADLVGLATKADVATVKADVAVVKADVAVVKADVDGLRGDVGSIRLELADFKVEVAEFKADVAGFRADMSDRFRELSLRLTTTMVTTMLAGIFGATGLAFAAAKLA